MTTINHKKIKIGIIGTGQIGSTLTRHFTRLGDDVVIANSRGPETLADLAGKTGARPVQASEVPRGRDLVVVTIPEANIPELPRDLFKNSPKNQADWGKPPGTPGRIAIPVAGDDPKSKQVVMDLVNDMGFDPVDAGGLDESWRQQPGTPVYDGRFDAEGVRRALAQAKPERKPDWRATPNSPGT